MGKGSEIQDVRFRIFVDAGAERAIVLQVTC